tara:strand:- start:903 stop:1160 length:258 start_codon:yes stop_codon:yes gene_type:complete
MMEKRTTISVNEDTKKILDSLKIIDRETYDNVILRVVENIIEDQFEINQQTKDLLNKRMENLNKGKVFSTKELIKKLREKRDGKV